MGPLSISVAFLMATAALAGKCDLSSWHRNVLRNALKQRAANAASTAKPCPEDPCPTSPLGPYKNIKFGKIDHVPGLKNGGKPSASIIYPDEALAGNVSFPILSWGHATFIGSISPGTDTAYIAAMATVASYGFVIIGADTCPLVECASLFHEDMLQVIASCSANRTLHPALKHADFTRTGLKVRTLDLLCFFVVVFLSFWPSSCLLRG